MSKARSLSRPPVMIGSSLLLAIEEPEEEDDKLGGIFQVFTVFIPHSPPRMLPGPRGIELREIEA